MAPTNVHVEYVLVPLDGSEFALRAMPTARVLAERFGAELQTVSVAGEDAADRLRGLASEALGVDVGDERVFVTEGDHVRLLRDAEANWIDVWCAFRPMAEGVCMERSIGSVARSVLQRSENPVVALGPSADNPGWSPRSAELAGSAVRTPHRGLRRRLRPCPSKCCLWRRRGRGRSACR